MDNPQQIVMHEWLSQRFVIVAIIAGHGISTPVATDHMWIFDLAGLQVGDPGGEVHLTLCWTNDS
jgi:hypothetical protein